MIPETCAEIPHMLKIIVEEVKNRLKFRKFISLQNVFRENVVFGINVFRENTVFGINFIRENVVSGKKFSRKLFSGICLLGNLSFGKTYSGKCCTIHHGFFNHLQRSIVKPIPKKLVLFTQISIHETEKKKINKCIISHSSQENT